MFAIKSIVGRRHRLDPAMIARSPTPPLLITSRERHVSASDSSKSSDMRRRIVEVVSPYPSVEDYQTLDKKKKRKKDKKHRRSKKSKKKKKRKHKSKSSSEESDSDSGWC